ncbi:hypothetical protein T12_3079, partial [Trichinella patagoniensis]
LDLEGEERQAAIDDWALCRQNYRVGKARARARMVEACGEGPIGSGSVSAGIPAVRSSNGRLPEITLPKFTGKVLEFPSFWAQFEANVHKRRDLDNATKFTYLLSNTGGTARNAIEGIPLTPENYTQAVDILKKRFGRPRLVIREHLAALWREPACREMTAQGIQSLVDEVTKHLCCLAALDRDPFAGRLPASEVLMPMLLDKFPPALIRAWDTNIGPDAAEEEDKLQKFLEFAQWQAGLLAKSKREETKPSASRSEQRTPSSKSSRLEQRYGDRVRSTAAALAVVAAKGCPFCGGGHKAGECERFQQAYLSGRKDMARIKGVCFRCLETGHMAKGCREDRPCGVDGCRQLHHKLLHPSPTTESPRSPRSDRAHQGLLAARGAPGGSLQTVRARAYGPDGNHVLVNCLFDRGAEVSFIRKDVTEVLGLTGPHERCRFTTLGGRVGPECKWRRVEFWLGAVGSSGRTEASTRVQALAIPRVCGKIQSVLIGLSDGTPTEPEMGQRHGTPLLMDVLIGIDYYYEFVTGRIRRTTSGTVAVETRLGWLVCGRTDPRQSSKAQVLLTKGEGPDDDILRRFWEIACREGPKLNDLVLILEDNVPRGRCPLGVVVELFPGGDGVARAARLRTSTAEMTRPVAKLVVLEPARVSDGRTIANGGRTIPAHRRPDRYLGIWQPRSGSERPRALTLTDDNGCLRHCAGCQQGTLKKPPDGRARQMAIARSKKAEGAAAY